MKKGNKNNVKINYDPEADVLAWEITKQPIDFAEEVGNIVVHFTKDNTPVLVEILEASKFLVQARGVMRNGVKFTDRKPILAYR